ncbi:MAG: DUF5989 family protein [Desulfovibrio sp.]|jgi:hypothetical protein|nr:DUF5989 family protein [Desulfovibrio sp.]MDR2669727.1 DUF5989 family protein [Desulfovibrio sp.]MDR2669951.1 DUF5989 family protein [Desulfovibrio sp.]
MNFLSELLLFLRVRKKYWLLPLIALLLFFGAIILFASGTVVAPFIYTLF